MKLTRDEPEPADPPWAPPSARAHRIASLVFGAIGIIFLGAFFVFRGAKYEWLLLGLGVIGCCRSIWHLIRSRFVQ